MSKSLFEFGDEQIIEEDVKKLESKLDENTKQNVQDLIEKYKNYSKEELVSEFISSSKQKLNEGTLSQNKIQQTFDSILPYLNSSQKEYFKNLLGKLNE